MGDQDFALVIGIGRYKDLPPLKGPADDAGRMRDWLVTGGEVPASQVELVTDAGADGQPRLVEVDDALDRILQAAQARPVRRLYVYFAGHGCARGSRHLALIMADATRERLNRSLDAQAYEDSIASYSPFSEQLFFYDCCRRLDWRVTGRIAELSGERPQPPAELAQLTLYATPFTRIAHERPDDLSAWHGLFTTALLEGLEGHAAVERDGRLVVTTTSLVPFVHRRLDELARRQGLRQKPDGHSPARELTLATVQEPRRHRVSVHVPPAARSVVVRDGRWQLVQELPASSGTPVQVELPPGIYVVMAKPGGDPRILEVPVEGPDEPELVLP